MADLFVTEILVIFVTAFIAGYIAVKLKQPPMIGYLAGGVLLSLPIFSNVVHFDISSNLSQIGVTLLMFSIGVEYPVEKLFKINKQTVFGVLIQFISFLIIVSITLTRFNFSLFESIFISSAFSNSATVVVLKILEGGMKVERKTSDSIINWLFLQDITMIFIAVLLESFVFKEKVAFYGILESFAKSFLFIAGAVILGKTIVPKFFNLISRLNSDEILLILSFMFCMMIAFFAEKVGFSYSLGAFLAGVMISETFINHEIFSEIKPIRNLFSVIFFISLGALVSPYFVIHNFFKIIGLLFILLGFKFITIFLVVVVLEKQTRKAFTIGLLMNQGGELALILSHIGIGNKWISEEFFSLVISIIILSIFLTPIFAVKVDSWYYSIREVIRRRSPRLYRYIFVQLDKIIDIDQPEMARHVVICGFGRVGTYVGRALEKEGIDYLVIDSSTETIDYCKQRGIKTIFGDASNIDVLEKADVERAVALVIALPETGATEIIASNARLLNPVIKIIARSHVPVDNKKLKMKGVNITVEPEFEAAVSISKKILNYFGKGTLDIANYLKKSRRRQRSRHNGQQNL